ncbi:MAG: DNA polymerase III subunit beta [Gammaproteobacteria bacterium]|jgi:DNA polymerase-3 subunit beta
MKLTAEREALLKPLQAVIGVVERRQTMPILSNVLLKAGDGQLSVTGTDLEVELIAEADVDVADPGDITVPGRKLHDIVRALPDGVTVELIHTGDRVSVKAGRSRFVLSSLPAADFPSTEGVDADRELTVSYADLRRLIDKTHFSMAQQDVRYYLNGLLIETEGSRLRAVATDGHRLALADCELASPAGRDGQSIVPRKGVLELNRLLGGDGELQLVLSANHLRVQLPGIRLTTKLIDGRFPDYGRVVPQHSEHILRADREALRSALQRAAILSNEKYRGIRLELGENRLVMQANNPEQEEATEELEVEYGGPEMEIGFNVSYLLDALGAVESETVELGLSDANSSCLITNAADAQTKFVVMPMRL